MKHHIFWLLILVICAVSLRVLYSIHSPLYLTTGDSVSYFLTAKNIVETKQIVDPWRTPVYPMMIAVPYFLQKIPMPLEISGIFTDGLMQVRVWQSVAGVVAAVLLYFICVRLNVSRVVSMIIALVATSDYILLLLEHTILTEAFALLWLTVLSIVFIRMLDRFRLSTLLCVCVLWCVGVFLRPSVIALPFVCVGILMFRYRSWKIFVYCAVALLIYGGSILWYSTINKKQSGFQGISRIQDVNMWGKILRMGITDKQLGESDMAAKAKAAMLVDALHPFEIFRQFPELYTAQYAGKFHTFTSTLVKDHLSLYAWQSITSIPSVLTMPTDLVDKTKTERYASFFLALDRFYSLLMYLAYIPLFGWPFIFFKAIKKHTASDYAALFMVLVGVYHIAITAGMSYNDFGRLMAIARPFILISVVIILRSIRKANV